MLMKHQGEPAEERVEEGVAEVSTTAVVYVWTRGNAGEACAVVCTLFNHPLVRVGARTESMSSFLRLDEAKCRHANLTLDFKYFNSRFYATPRERDVDFVSRRVFALTSNVISTFVIKAPLGSA